MPTCELPENPDLGHLRNQAKTLQRGARAGDRDAMSLVGEFHPRPGPPAAGGGGLPAFSRADALLVVARRYGFHKTTLAVLCGEVGIEYRHLPELGIASEHPKGDTAFATRDDLLDWYESEHLPTVPAAVRELAESVAHGPTAVMCREANPCECHRSRLARRVADLTGLPVAHLRPSN